MSDDAGDRERLRFQRLGILDVDAPDCEDQLRLLRNLVARGASEAALVEAGRSGRLGGLALELTLSEGTPVDFAEAASAAGLRPEAAARLDRIGVPAADILPTSLADYLPTAIDGKKLKYVLKRLKPFRGLKGNVLGGKVLAAQDMASGMALAIEAA